ncbi:hypothetical protein ACFOW6_09000 [Fodinicurvata halophila]|uniref:Uncharacterized protein n=1 Tax=Fodinicurvata halophila TaxID=1419723 RepID=A0ABV8UM51_9PROT
MIEVPSSTSIFQSVQAIPGDLKTRVLTTNIDLDEGTCSIELLEEVSVFFGLGLNPVRKIIQEVAADLSTWRDVAKEVSARDGKIMRIASVFCMMKLERVQSL